MFLAGIVLNWIFPASRLDPAQQEWKYLKCYQNVFGPVLDFV